MTVWMVLYGGSYLGTVQAKTAAAALRKARYEWGSGGEWTDAQLKKFSVRKANPGGRVRRRTSVRRRVARGMARRATGRRVATALKKFVRGNPALPAAFKKAKA